MKTKMLHLSLALMVGLGGFFPVAGAQPCESLEQRPVVESHACCLDNDDASSAQRDTQPLDPCEGHCALLSVEAAPKAVYAQSGPTANSFDPLLVATPSVGIRNVLQNRVIAVSAFPKRSQAPPGKAYLYFKKLRR